MVAIVSGPVLFWKLIDIPTVDQMIDLERKLKAYLRVRKLVLIITYRCVLQPL